MQSDHIAGDPPGPRRRADVASSRAVRSQPGPPPDPRAAAGRARPRTANTSSPRGDRTGPGERNRRRWLHMGLVVVKRWNSQSKVLANRVARQSGSWPAVTKYARSVIADTGDAVRKVRPCIAQMEGVPDFHVEVIPVLDSAVRDCMTYELLRFKMRYKYYHLNHEGDTKTDAL